MKIVETDKTDAPTVRPDADEVATIEKDLDIFSGWADRMENPDPVLETESNGEGIKLYDQVERDPHASSVLQTRRESVAELDWEIVPADDSPKQAEIAQFLTDNLLNGTNFTQATSELMKAVLYGFYCAEIMWGEKHGQWVPIKFIGKHPRRFSFTPMRELRLLTPENMLSGEPVPDRKFIHFSHGDSDNPFGAGLGQKLWWYVWFKKHGVKFMMVRLDKFGMPTPIGKYPSGSAKPQQDKLLESLKAMQTDAAIIIPENMQCELIEAAGSGSAPYEGALDYFDRAISKCVLGQTLTTEVKGHGSLAASKTHETTQEKIISSDAQLFCGCINETIIKWMVELNFAGVEDLPTIQVKTENETDLNELQGLSIAYQRMSRMGQPISQEHISDRFQIPLPKEGETIVEPPESQGEEGETPEFAQDTEAPSATVDGLVDLMSGGTKPMLAPIEKLLAESKDLAEFRDGLLDVFDDMDPSSFAANMQRALVLADLSGRFDEDEDSE